MHARRLRRRPARAGVVAVIVAALMLTTACAATMASSGGAEGSRDVVPLPVPVPAAPTPRPVSSLLRPDHVMIVVLENKDAADVQQQAPYLTSLGASGASFTDMHAETHPSQANYIALFAGDTHGITDDSCPHMIDAPNLASMLADAGFTFTGYAEYLPAAGYAGCDAGSYARKHSPWVNFRNVAAAANQPMSAMPSDLATLPTVSFLIPNLCHDMHDCSISEGDTWLQSHIDGYARWARTHNSLLIVTFDESGSAETDNHIATFAVGQRVRRGPYPARADHYALLRTLEDMYGLPHLGHTADAGPLDALWTATP